MGEKALQRIRGTTSRDTRHQLFADALLPTDFGLL